MEDIFNFSGFQMLARVDELSAKTLGTNFPEKEKLTVIFAADAMPLPSIGHHAKIENPRIFSVHRRMRNALKRRNTLAFSMCSDFAWKLCRQLLSDSAMAALLAEYQSQIASYETKEEVVEVLLNGAYNKVEKIRHGGSAAIKKTFRFWQLPCLHRELNFHNALSHMKEISDIIEADKCSFIMPYHQSSYQWDADGMHPLPLNRVKRIFDAVREIWESGYAMLDCHPGNFIFLNERELKVIDHEFSVRHESPSLPFNQSWLMTGAPKEILNSMPMSENVTYENTWIPAIGLTYEAMLNASPSAGLRARQYMRRLPHMPRICSKLIRQKIYNHRQWHVAGANDWLYLRLSKKYR